MNIYRSTDSPEGPVATAAANEYLQLPAEDRLDGWIPRLGELFVTGRDTAMRFDLADEVLHVMALPVVAAVEAGWLEPIAPRTNASPAAVGAETVAKNLRIEILLDNDAAITRAGQQRGAPHAGRAAGHSPS